MPSPFPCCTMIRECSWKKIQKEKKISFKRLIVMASSYKNSTNFWWDKFFNNTIRLLPHYVSINFLYWTPFLFFSFRHFYLSTQFLCLLTCLSLQFLPSILFRSCCFLYAFGCCYCWIPWIRLFFHYGKH